jgi:polyisoprenoid-binding protein YceI
MSFMLASTALDEFKRNCSESILTPAWRKNYDLMTPAVRPVTNLNPEGAAIGNANMDSLTGEKVRIVILGLILLTLVYVGSARGQGTGTYEFAPAETALHFSLEASLHTVHGEFRLKHGTVHFDPASGAISGEIVADATSGKTGNDGRDRRMHGEILETALYPEIVFRPDRVEGKLGDGASTLQVHGIFSIHGAEHEMTLPVQVEMAAGHWTASSHFVIPYVKWGIKNPSNFFLHVSQEAGVDVKSSGMRP